MSTKLTLTLQKEVIENAKRYAASQGRSLSEMVENYFKFLTDDQPKEQPLSPRVSRLKGVVKVSEDFDYEAVLKSEKDQKHGR